MTSSSSRLSEVVGRIRIPYDEEEVDEDSDEDDYPDSWLDNAGDGGGRVKSKRPKTRDVIIHDQNGGKHKCKGRFPLLQPYWTVKAKKPCLQSFTYFIRQDEGYKPVHIMLFLDDCLTSLHAKIRDPVKQCFEIFCKANLGGDALTFSNVETMLNQFVISEKTECSFEKFPNSNGVGRSIPDDHGEHVKKTVLESGLGATVLRAVSHPQLVERLSELLPYSFQNFLAKLQSLRLDTAQAMAVDTPWEFGFRQIVYDKLRISGAEATHWMIEKAGLFPSIPEKEKDALHIYEVLKVDAQKGGHMYMPFKTMTTYYYFEKLKYRITSMHRWKEALTYLEENKVIVLEEFDQDTNVFLSPNWKAETDCVRGVQTVLAKYESEKDNMNVDFSSSDFDTIRSDPDQLKASRLIARLPIVVLSGMGGCGKTTVVTNLLKHLCSREEKKSLPKTTLILEGVETNNQQQQKSADPNTTQGDEFPSQSSSESEKATIGESSTNTNNTNNNSSGKLTAGSDRDGTEDGEDEDRTREKEEESSSTTTARNENESKDERLRRELNEDLVKILKEKKNEDSETMKAFKRQILLVAPTGKAARLLGCKARLPSATVHSVIMSWRLWQDRKRAKERNDENNKDKEEDGGKEEEEEPEWTYSFVKTLVVDECSLLSVRLFAAILTHLIQDARLARLVLLGDVKQLPSIEPGDFLRTVFRAFARPSFSIELTQNHRSESQLIVDNAGRIAQNRLPTFNPAQNFHFIKVPENGGDNERDFAISQLLNTNEDLLCHVQSQFVSLRNDDCKAINELCCKHYNKHTLLTYAQKKQVNHFEAGDKICFCKNQRVNNQLKILDEYFQSVRHLVGDPHRPQNLAKDISSSSSTLSQSGRTEDDNTTRRRLALNAAEVTSLFTGDESDLDKTVSALRVREAEEEARRTERRARAEERRREWQAKHAARGKEEGKKPPGNEEKLCNGEVFFIMDVKTTLSADNVPTSYLILSDRDPSLPRVVCVPEKVLRKDCKMKHSWVRTIHTYQGSESPTVVYFVGTAIPQNWQHVYTAVTRGKNSVYIVGKPSQLEIAVTRKPFPRRSRLYERLSEMLNEKSDLIENLKVTPETQTTDFVSADGANQSDPFSLSAFEDEDDIWISSILDPLPLPDLMEKSSAGVKGAGGSSPLSRITTTTTTTMSPKRSPPRLSATSQDSQSSPPKRTRLVNAVDTPFQNAFTDTLSLERDDDGSINEDPLPPSPPLHAKKKLFKD